MSDYCRKLCWMGNFNLISNNFMTSWILWFIYALELWMWFKWNMEDGVRGDIAEMKIEDWLVDFLFWTLIVEKFDLIDSKIPFFRNCTFTAPTEMICGLAYITMRSHHNTSGETVLSTTICNNKNKNCQSCLSTTICQKVNKTWTNRPERMALTWIAHNILHIVCPV